MQENVDLYNSLREIKPLRNIELPDELEFGGIDIDESDDMPSSNAVIRPRSATGALGMHKLSDMQTALQYLNDDLGEDLNHMVYGRTFPDVYNPLSKMLVKDILLKSKGNPHISVVNTITRVNTALSKSIDGEAIIDLLTLMGAKRAVDDEKEKNSMLGI
jgi:hypothetical protein